MSDSIAALLRRRKTLVRQMARLEPLILRGSLIERYKALDTEIDGGTSEDFLTLVRRETPKWAAVIKRANVKVD